MPLAAHQRIVLEELLLQREAFYARVHAIETEVHRIFRETYPLPPPPVEVAQPGIKRPAAKPTPKETPFKLRELTGNEAAYRVRFHAGAGVTHEQHTDRKAVEALLRSPMAKELIQSVETVDVGGSVRSLLYPLTHSG